MKALVVDDSKAIRSILKKFLVGLGFEVIEAGHGQEALSKLKDASPPELALVDWNMPVMDGLEFVSSVREDRGLDAMAVMMVTTESEASQIDRALAAGANEYVMKPFTPEILRDKLAILGLSAWS